MKRTTNKAPKSAAQTIDHDATVKSAEDAWEAASQVLEAAKATGDQGKIDAARAVFVAKRAAYGAACDARLAADPKKARALAESAARNAAILAPVSAFGR